MTSFVPEGSVDEEIYKEDEEETSSADWKDDGETEDEDSTDYSGEDEEEELDSDSEYGD